MFRKFIALTVCLLSLTIPVRALENEDISAECAVLMTAQTGCVIFEKNAHRRHSMASTTKIMTSLLAVESGKMQNEIKVTSESVNAEGTSMGLAAGDCVSLEELCYGMLLPSGNDAANAAAQYLGGSVGKFAGMMNSRAEKIGMTDTNFVTPSGLDDENHYSTAYDMALLGREAVKNPLFLEICSSRKAAVTFGSPPAEHILYNHNRLLSSCDEVLGIKTGFTKKSGRCLVTYAQKDGVGLVAVTLNAPDDWNDHMKLLVYGFETVSAAEKTVPVPAELSVAGGESDFVKISQPKTLIESTAVNISCKVYLPRFLYAPVRSGDIVGRADIYSGEVLIDSVCVTAESDIRVNTKKDKGFFDKLKEIIHD